MSLVEALAQVASCGGSVYVLFRGTPYRLVVRDGYVRLVLQEAGRPFPLPPEDALSLLREMAREEGSLEAYPSPVEVPVVPPECALLAEARGLLSA